MLAVMHAPNRRSFAAAVALAGLWGIGLALPALLRGELLGHGWTDLYPSVWGLWAFASGQPGLPATTGLLGFPEGMGFYYSSPIKGWLAWGLLPLFGLTATWNLLTLAARVATVLCAWGAGRAWGLGPHGALVAAATFGCSPFFHGYAVEGIAEGTDGWTLALLLWALGARRHLAAAALLALTIASSWYLGAAGCLLTLASALRDRRALGSLVGGLALCAPFLVQFLAAFPSGAPLPDDIRAAMGAPLQIPTPGLQEGVQPFARTAYVGWVLGALTLAGARRSWRLALLATVPAVLSLGSGPWYDLPVLEALRFPYRWHAATLAVLALIAGRLADDRGWGWLALLITAEGVALSPVEPLVPGASAEVPPIYAHVQGPVLELPGPVAAPPGRINPSRPRSRYLLFFQTRHGQPSPWVPDFNAVGVSGGATAIAPFRSWDPVEERINGLPSADGLPPGLIDRLGDAGIRHVVVHRQELGGPRAGRLKEAMIRQGATLSAEDGERWILDLPR